MNHATQDIFHLLVSLLLEKKIGPGTLLLAALGYLFARSEAFRIRFCAVVASVALVWYVIDSM